MRVIREWSWDQIGLASRCVIRHQVHMLELIIKPLVIGMGGEVADTTVSAPYSEADDTPEAKEQRAKERDARLFQTLAQHGVTVHSE